MFIKYVCKLLYLSCKSKERRVILSYIQIKEKVVNTYLDLFKDYKAESMLNGKIFGFCPQKATMKQFKAAEKYLKLIISKGE